MNGVGPGAACRVDDQVAAQVSVRRRIAGQRHGRIGVGDVRQAAIGIGVDGDGGDAEVAAGPHHPPGDLATIGHEHRPNHGRNTPNRSVPATGALWAADNAMPSTVRVSRGSMIPSS